MQAEPAPPFSLAETGLPEAGKSCAILERVRIGRREFLGWGAGLLAGCASAGLPAGRRRWVVGSNTALWGSGLHEAIAAVKGLGIPAVEIHPFGAPEPTPRQFPGFEFDRMTGAAKQALRRSLEGFPRITTHLPFKQLSFFDLDEALVRKSERALEAAMEATAYVGAEMGVLHVTPPRGRTLEEARPDILAWLRRCGDRATSLGFRVSVETGYPRSVDEFVRLIHDAGHDAVGGCIDVGHQIGFREFASWKGERRGTAEGIRAYNDLIEGLALGLGPRLTHLHVHDIDPVPFKEHRPIRYGVVDYPRLFDALERVGYRGLLMLEVEADAPEEIALSRRELERHMGRG